MYENDTLLSKRDIGARLTFSLEFATLAATRAILLASAQPLYKPG